MNTIKVVKKTKTRLKTWAILSIIITNKKVTIPTSALKRQEISNSLNNFYVNNWEQKKEIRLSTLHLICRKLQKVKKSFARLKMRS